MNFFTARICFAEGAKDFLLNSLFLLTLVNDDFFNRISTKETALDCPYSEHFEVWTSFRADTFFGCPEQLVDCFPAAKAHRCFSGQRGSGEDAHRPLLPDAGSPPSLLQGDPTGRRRQELPCGRRD